jgi:hypothetical protein
LSQQKPLDGSDGIALSDGSDFHLFSISLDIDSTKMTLFWLLAFVLIHLGILVLLVDATDNHAQSSDTSWHLMCEMKHKSEFVFDASVTNNGCKLNCVVLTSSQEDRQQFFDKSDIFEHNLNDGIYCKRDHVCHDGNCTIDWSTGIDKKGIVIIDVLDAKLPNKDTMTSSDGYVKVSTMGPAGDLLAGKTKVIWDNNNPSWNHTFKVERVSMASTIFFELFDKDMIGGDDYIATAYIAIKKIVRDGLNSKVIKLDFPDGSIRVTVTWLTNEES